MNNLPKDININNISIDDFINEIAINYKEQKEETKLNIRKWIKSIEWIVLDDTNCSELKNDSDQLYYFEVKITTKKATNPLSKLFYSLFSTKNPFIVHFNYGTYNCYFCNSSYLKNEYIDKILDKKSIYIELNEKLNEYFNYEKLNKSSIINLFNDFIYRLIFFYYLKVQNNFKKYLSYESLFEYSKLDRLMKQKKAIQNKLKNLYSSDELIDANNKINEINEQINKIKKLIEGN